MKWWQNAVIYQIYPRSFQDSNGDGIGDIPGIISRLDYLQELGIDAIWLSPVYESPNDDNGYDISNYQAIHPEFGTMDDMDRLIEEAKTRNIRIVMDLVVNHTSDEHKWFVEAKKGRENPYRDYYIWRDPVDGQAPNDLGSTFSGSAWTFDEASGQYYMHLFSKKQPDLNWENETMRQEVYDMMNFWLDKGVGGFRMDVIDLIAKVPDHKITADGPKLHAYLKDMHEQTLKDREVMTVGETWSATPESAKLYSDPDRNELSMVFQFEHMMMDEQPGKSKWDLKELDVVDWKEVLTKWQVELKEDGWNSLFWNNHDTPRVVSRWGNDKDYRVESAKCFAILLHLMRGTPYIYQGEEIGMTNRHVTSIDEVDDIESRNMYAERLAQGYSKADILKSINVKGRDNARTPIHWNQTDQAGFTEGTPWLKVQPNYKEINVEQALADKDSVFYTYQKLIQIRKENPAIVWGSFNLLLPEHPTVFAYERLYKNEKWVVVTNLSADSQIVSFETIKDQGNVVVSNYDRSSLNWSDLTLKPFEAMAVQFV
ncbi:glycoside hydrolase family 13 protein [Alkalibacterium olivapovliticus]|uniref:Glucan 1,6-alpha-glucosidase n=1 Tax=Alkalibacterium olivapovliticus TaxID=99907 RepID=A0A2T0W8Y7_9LACT|nr:alpha-glucosidase [Alkalibacterium olivapovliticus]PRY83153.1 glucan 1,6-alpha-glucosidase [Alkalibacterium olivapovliticus]